VLLQELALATGLVKHGFKGKWLAKVILVKIVCLVTINKNTY
jgi:hypothetical protein